MKRIIVILALVSAYQASSQVNFDDYFLPKTLRFDYTRAGNSDTSFVYFEQIKEEPFWGGSKVNMIDKFNFGHYRIMLYDSTGNKLIYSRGYSSLFYEWIDTDEAKNVSRSYYESVVMPFPKNKVVLKLQNRDRKNVFHTVFEYQINPNNYFIVKDKTDKYSIEKFYGTGEPAKSLDIVVLPEGYTTQEMTKFKMDVGRFVTYFFKVAPFRENRNKINFWMVNASSEESGTDIPGDSVWRNTVLNTHFYTFSTERYITTRDVKQIRDLAAYAPYDQIYILVNSKKYGGGGIYNYYNLCTSDHNESEQVFTHEFGHAFAALADEYHYDIDNAEELYDLSVEPWQVNISSLVDFESKWKNFVDKDTPIPTPDTDEYKNKVGAFEGGGYVKKKIYRPVQDCKMRSNHTNEFCPVCLKAVTEMLKFYSE